MRDFARQYRFKGKPLHLLINNAGVMLNDFKSLSHAHALTCLFPVVLSRCLLFSLPHSLPCSRLSLPFLLFPFFLTPFLALALFFTRFDLPSLCMVLDAVMIAPCFKSPFRNGRRDTPCLSLKLTARMRLSVWLAGSAHAESVHGELSRPFQSTTSGPFFSRHSSSPLCGKLPPKVRPHPHHMRGGRASSCGAEEFSSWRARWEQGPHVHDVSQTDVCPRRHRAEFPTRVVNVGSESVRFAPNGGVVFNVSQINDPEFYDT